jgi:HD-like signal output (HDOD) protein
MHNLETLLEQSDELPALPEIYLKVSDLLEAENSTAQNIGQAVQTDPLLTGKILKMINSAFYGMPSQVTSIPQAVTLLGRSQIKQILMGSVLADVFSSIDIANFSMRDFWQHSIKTAIIGRHLGLQNAQVIDHEAFFTAGILHDIGRLVMAKAAPEVLMEIDGLLKSEDLNVVQLESEKLGVTHIQVGEALMKKWSMPSFIVQSVLKHHDVEHFGPFAISTSIVYLANQLSQHVITDDEEGIHPVLEKIPNWQQTGCTSEQIFIACQLADEQWFEVMESLGMLDMEKSEIRAEEGTFFTV